jgi:F420-dependent methylenetetrahydromethanopterin dehydrogenase
MIECLEKFTPSEYEEEDRFFTRNLKKIDSNLPKFIDANKFSIENVYCEDPYAIHKAWRFLEIDKVLANVVL